MGRFGKGNGIQMYFGVLNGFVSRRSSRSLSTLFLPERSQWSSCLKYSCLHLTVFSSSLSEKKKITEWSLKTSQPSTSCLEDLTLPESVTLEVCKEDTHGVDEGNEKSKAYQLLLNLCLTRFTSRTEQLRN